MHDEIIERDIGRVNKHRILLFIPIIFLFFGMGFAIFDNSWNNLFSGLRNIIFSPTILMTDFLKIGGIGATFVNVALVGFLNILIIKHYKMKINGVLIAAFFTVIGFSFFGKNIYNTLPIYLGGFLYTRYQKKSFKEVVAVVMFGTALSPFISEVSFLGIFPQLFAVVIAIILGIFIGFVITPLSSHMLRFHNGYNIYNIGFTAGIIGTFFTSLLRSFGIQVEPVRIIYEKNHAIIIALLCVIFAGLLIVGLIVNKKSIVQFRRIFKFNGTLVTDFTHLVGYGVTFVNMGLLGFTGLAYVLIIGGVVNGPSIAGIMTLVGFGALGKHHKNCFPIVIGVMLTALFFGYDLASTEIVLAVLFSTTLAPIAGKYGPIIGIVAGVFHMILVMNVGVIHGGINLYNNGFAGGLVAGILVPIVEAFKKEE